MARTKQTARARASLPAGIAYRRAQPLPTKQNRQSNDMSDMSDMSEKNQPVKPRIRFTLKKGEHPSKEPRIKQKQTARQKANQKPKITHDPD